MAETIDYKKTVLIPKTDFPMRANLVQREPQIQQRWREMQLYQKIRESRKGCPRFILHDGPPYANGDIHMGHLINKVLKDIVVRLRTMQGYDAPYVPGWDCHGLPIEHKVLDELGPQRAAQMDKNDIRRRCHDYAAHYMKVQSEQFQRLGVIGQWDRPYYTMDPAYEAEVIRSLADLVEAGLVYRELKTVAWCPECRTALAEAELEYEDIPGPSIYVDFPLTEESLSEFERLFGWKADASDPPCMMIWTTTPWTLVANMAIAVGAEFEYQAVRYEKQGRVRTSIIASRLIEQVMQAGGGRVLETSRAVTGKDLTPLRYRHVFVDRTCPVVLADYVRLEDGTGLVHTAPGHGEEDYLTGRREGLEIYCPVREDGSYDDTVPDFLKGGRVPDVDETVIRKLAQDGWLFQAHEVTHSYPHCWRSKTPIVFRAAEQWFIAVDKPIPGIGKTLRQLALEWVDKVSWIPAWGKNRIRGMLESRPDWCISRQRVWGLPIPAFYNDKGQILLSAEAMRRVADHFARKGSDSWYTDGPKEILGEDFPLPEGFNWENIRKETDILDVWFESGNSWRAVCKATGLGYPADLYLEGSDQHRGWFQLSLLPALACTGKPPFKTVLTHGFVVDEQGYKMSKSAGNYVSATDAVNRYGADVLRLWVSSVDYQNDIRTSETLISHLQDAYRKVRNTLRFLLGATHDFNPEADSVPVEGPCIDKWARLELHKMIRDVLQYYENYEFYRVFRRIHDFCAVQMSSIYFSALKDRLYCDLPESRRRRRAQTVLHEMACALVRLIAPILVHTAEETWGYLRHKPEQTESVHMAHFPQIDPAAIDEETEKDFEVLLQWREEALRKLEHLKTASDLANPLDAAVILTVPPELEPLARRYEDDLEDLIGVGWHEIRVAAGKARVEIEDLRSKYPRCARCWKRRPDVGSDSDFPDLSARDAAVVRALLKRSGD